jgi:2,3-bisphosphoglycerate-dependent phosphoglycerate mutase
LSSIILVRHGKSLWNKENRFTGWTDISLSNDGINEAELAAQEILEKKLIIHKAYSSIFRRAYNTGEIILKNSKNKLTNIVQDWRLNERHYGNLQGLNKSETSKKYGDDKVLEWRRSFKTKPPLLDQKTYDIQITNPLFKQIPKESIPYGESLEDTVKRVKMFCNEILYKKLEEKNNILIAAHGNSLRALIKIIENKSEKETEKLEIQTGKPIFYTYKEKIFTKVN